MAFHTRVRPRSDDARVLSGGSVWPLTDTPRSLAERTTAQPRWSEHWRQQQTPPESEGYGDQTTAVTASTAG